MSPILEAATSISRETWRRASPSNNRRVRVFLAAVAAGIVISFLAALPWGEIGMHWRERRDQRRALAPMLAEARKANLSFPEVVVAHPAHAGKIVYWDVTVVSSTASYAAGRPAWPIVWTNPDRVLVEDVRGPESVLARVAGVRDDIVYLDYLGRP